MTRSLSPEIQRFIDEQVKEGRFASPEDLIEAAVADMRDADEALDEEDLAAIREADAQLDRGEGIELSEVRARLAKQFPGVR